MTRFLTFILVGSFFSTVEEFLTVVVLKRDVASFVFTLLILFPTFLIVAYVAGSFLDRRVRMQARRDLIYYFGLGCLGLMVEWFLIGLSPWADPNADPLVMLIFQLGMFSFWASVAFLPRLFVSDGALQRSIRKPILGFYIPYFMIVYVIAFSAPSEVKFVAIIALTVFGYLFLNLFYARYFLGLARHDA